MKRRRGKKNKTTKPFVTVVLVSRVNDQKVIEALGGRGKERCNTRKERKKRGRRSIKSTSFGGIDKKIEASKSNGKTGRERHDKKKINRFFLSAVLLFCINSLPVCLSAGGKKKLSLLV